MEKIKQILDNIIGDFSKSVREDVYFNNETIAQIFNEKGIKVYKDVYGEINLSAKDLMCAILLKHAEYYADDGLHLSIDDFRKIWINTKERNYGGIDIIFDNVINSYDTNLVPVIYLLKSSYDRKVFSESLTDCCTILQECDREKEYDIIINKVKPALDIYVEAAKEFEKIEDEFYKNFNEKLQKVTKR